MAGMTGYSGVPAGILRLAVLGSVAALGLSGCGSVLEPLVGKKDAGSSLPAGPPPIPSTASFVSGFNSPNPYSGQGAAAPTLAFDTPDDSDSDSEPAVAQGPSHPIASAPLTPDVAALAALPAAVRRQNAGPDARFVLLVLAPPAIDAATLDRTNAAARAAAAAAVEALGEAGVPADHVEVSLATNPEVGNGEVRLYVR